MPRLATANATQLRNAKPRATDWRIGCGKGLYLRITPSGFKYWQIRYKGPAGKETIKQFGSFPDISLEQARLWRDQFLAATPSLALGRLSATAPFRSATQSPVSPPSGPSFQTCASRLIEAKAPEWRNAKHAAQWRSTLEQYAFPVFGPLPIEDLRRDHVLQCLEPIWISHNETASRLRGRIESVWNWAKAHDLVKGDNPAAWKGGLQNLLAAPAKVQRVQSHPAMPYRELPAFMQRLASLPGAAALALRWLILNASRTTEVRHATWDELRDGLWVISAERMKAAREHRIPLSQQAQNLLNTVPRSGPYLFGSVRGASGSESHRLTQHPLSDMAMTSLLRRHLGGNVTVHGFRSSFRDWTAEQTVFAREVCEHALAHQLPDKVEAAYLRTDWLDKRRELMQAWADFVCTD